jgi:hypothetical protein
MDISALIESTIGIMFVWILLAMITSQIQEWVASVFRWRASMLQDAIRGLLNDDHLAEKFYEHPIIKSFHTNLGTREPSYIPDSKFALVLFDVFLKAGTEGSIAQQTDSTFQQLKLSINNLQGKYPNVATSLDTLLLGLEEKVNQSDVAIAESKKRVESWFNDTMDRLSGAYRRRVQLVAIIAGVLLAFALNADSLAIFNKLWSDPMVRQAVVQQAQQAQANQQANQPPASPEAVKQYVDQLQGLSIPLGWAKDNIPAANDPNGWFVKIGGILISGIAAAQGAPFWFDMMKKLINVRSSGAVSSSASTPAPAAGSSEPPAVG